MVVNTEGGSGGTCSAKSLKSLGGSVGGSAESTHSKPLETKPKLGGGGVHRYYVSMSAAALRRGGTLLGDALAKRLPGTAGR